MTATVNLQEVAVQEAVKELRAAENFFSQAEAYQVDYATARLDAAKKHVDMLVKSAKVEEVR